MLFIIVLGILLISIKKPEVKTSVIGVGSDVSIQQATLPQEKTNSSSI
jgi:hypothetical protein